LRYNRAKRKDYMIASIIYAIGGFIEVLVGLRFVFRLIGANASNAIVGWVYTWSTPFVAPFSGIFGQDATVVNGIGTATNSVFDWAALIALVVIGLVVGVIGGLFGRRHTA
jgi:uncharacterized protein YggT (Ycf19 family)